MLQDGTKRAAHCPVHGKCPVSEIQGEPLVAGAKTATAAWLVPAHPQCPAVEWVQQYGFCMSFMQVRIMHVKRLAYSRCSTCFVNEQQLYIFTSLECLGQCNRCPTNPSFIEKRTPCNNNMHSCAYKLIPLALIKRKKNQIRSSPFGKGTSNQQAWGCRALQAKSWGPRLHICGYASIRRTIQSASPHFLKVCRFLGSKSIITLRMEFCLLHHLCNKTFKSEKKSGKFKCQPG